MKNKKSPVIVTTKTGKIVRLLNPAEKANKAFYELKTGVKHTNFGIPKVDKYGNLQGLNEKERSYRSGYVSAIKDTRNAHNAKRKAKPTPPYLLQSQNQSDDTF